MTGTPSDETGRRPPTPGATRHVATPRDEAGSWSGFLERLRTHSPPQSRYTFRDEVARGGMGAILKVWDQDLGRHLAMKVIVDPATPGDAPSTHVDDTTLGRFLEEAQVTGQLDHPGIVPVHELGLDDSGQPYFTMRLVKGRTLTEVLELVKTGEQGWNLTRALGVLLKVCEAMSYAHAKGVIHRDLKPANVMVGRFGEVYVMDWGLARELGREDRHDIRLTPAPPSISVVETERQRWREESPDSPLLTRDGHVMGTPSYMPPEQARGDVENVDHRSDVYSVGAMLYSLLTSQPPYVNPGDKVHGHIVLRWVLDGPPRPVLAIDPDAPPDLVAICEKAMARERSARYADMQSLADELRAHLEGRVVHAYESGALAEVRKWVGRNRAVAASLALIVALATGSGFGYAWLERKNAIALAQRNEQVNQALALEEESRRVAEQRQAEIEQANDELLAAGLDGDRLRLLVLVGEARDLWPAAPLSHVALSQLEGWIAKAEDLAGRGELYRQRLQTRPSPGMAEFIEALDTFGGPEPFPGSLQDMLDRRDRLRQLTRRSLEHEGWPAATAAIAGHPAYGGLELSPQLGLVPLGPDPDSGLWEFADLQTGEPPRRVPEGSLVLDGSEGIVLVLLPGATFRMGAQRDDPGAPNYSASAQHGESPVHEVTLSAPFFLSKYEMTVAQWERCHPDPYEGPDDVAPSSLPVSQVSWHEADAALTRLGMQLPTEAQWEYAARSSSMPALEGVVAASAEQRAAMNVLGHHDGFAGVAPVGSFPANGFGLHDMQGNLWEWCRDAFDSYGLPVDPADGLRRSSNPRLRVRRGGSFTEDGYAARITSRGAYEPGLRQEPLGVRPARAVER